MIARIWRGMIAAAPPRFWAQVGAGMALTLFAAGVVFILWLGPWSLSVERARVDALARICLAVLFLVLVALAAITELKLGINAGREGFRADVERDDEPHTVDVAGQMTITPQPTKGEQ